MAVFRIERTRDYTVMSNHHLRNANLSLKAKGLLSMMLSLPEDWNYTTRGLAKICKEGVDAIGAALRELEATGYIVRHKLRDSKGRISDTEYVIYEQPQLRKPDTDSPDTENPYMDKLTIAMLNEFIEKILVHERDRKGSTQTTQEVEIYFNFVGRFVPPAFGEVELTPEELEEIRKREERKDRLHQNYLKRKASGAQKQYENKIKDKRKAEIEAKKAAIRAEDIAKGVFVPVSQLPTKEPKKGVQTA